jgi:virulence factor Mce-like protein
VKLTRFVRIQLIIFTIASVIGVSVMCYTYLQVPRLLGVGHLTVKLELPTTGGLYQFGNVTYRGVQVGKVTDLKVIGGRRVEATLSLDTSPRIPASSIARVRSVSAVGEQYVDLWPPNDAGPYLQDGSTITVSPDSMPQPAGPMLDKLSALVESVPTGNIGTLMDETNKAFNGAGYDFGSLIDSSTAMSNRLNDVSTQLKTLIDDSGPLLDGQNDSSDALRTWAQHLAGITGQIVDDDPQIRTLLRKTPSAATELTRLFDQVKPTLPVLLANLVTIGQIGVTYHPSIEQLLILLPPNVANVQSYLPGNNPTGMAIGDFAVSLSDPPACTVGFLPPSQWRSPADTTTIDTPDGLYCKLPQDSPIAVRGARNYPCMSHPGKRAPTVEICDSDKPYMPLAMRQHALGPYPLDPNLIAQGVPPDSRINSDNHLFGPVNGTPPPPDTPPASPDGSRPVGPPSGPDAAPTAQQPSLGPSVAAPAPGGGAPASGIAPSAYHPAAPAGSSVAIVHYDQRTGAYTAPDGRTYVDTNVTHAGGAKSWRDLVAGPT